MIGRDGLPVGFTMELAMSSKTMNRFSGLTEPEQKRMVDGTRNIESHEDICNYVKNIFTEGRWHMGRIQIPGRQEPGRQEPLGLPDRNSSTYGDGDIPEIDLFGADSATHDFLQGFSGDRMQS